MQDADALAWRTTTFVPHAAAPEATDFRWAA